MNPCKEEGGLSKLKLSDSLPSSRYSRVTYLPDFFVSACRMNAARFPMAGGSYEYSD